MTAAPVDTGAPAAAVLERLAGVIRRGGGWLARCPAHEDRRQSLTVSTGTDGRVLLHCHAGCSTRQVVEAAGLAMGDLFPAGGRRRGHARPARTLVATYDYTDAQGTLLYQVCRFEPKDFRQRRPDGAGGWIWKLDGVERVLYRLPAVEQAIAAGRVVFVVEGEKDVHALEAIGCVATTNAQGAGKWSAAHSAALRGATVACIPDNDEPGRAHMADVAQSLLAAGVRDVRILALDVPPKGDVADWIGDGHTAAELKRLVRAAPRVAAVAPEDAATPPPARDEVPPPDDAPPADAPEAELEGEGDEFFRCTDLGNGERFAAAYGDDVRFVPQLDAVFLWDGTHWARDLTYQVQHLAKAVVRGIRAEADRATKPEVKAAIVSWAKRSEADPRIRALLARAKAEPGLAVLQSALDRDPWILAVANGALDLRTGALREHRRDDLSTYLVPIAYDAEAACPRWQRFLTRVMDGNTDVIGFLQRAVGYSLTGSTQEQVLFFLHGSGANGKSTFLEILRALVGGYAMQADFTTFLERRGDGPRNDVARLRGARVVTSSEVGEGKRLDESLVKSLTGSDTIAARLLYRESFEFAPQFKLWLAANHKPVIRGTDQAIWRRVRLIPFTVEIPEAERDPDLVAALRDELPGILAWAVQGCRDWQEYGLAAPDAVRHATEEYRRESDVLGTFLEARCELGDAFSTASTELYRAYKRWAEETGEFVLSQTAFGRRLSDRGIGTEKRGHANGVHRIGVRILAEDESRPSASGFYGGSGPQEDFL